MTGPEASNVLCSLSNQTTRPLPVDPTVPYDWRWMLKSIIGRPMIVLGLAALFMIVATMAVAMRTAEYQAVTTVSITNLRLAPGGRDAFYAEVQFDPTFPGNAGLHHFVGDGHQCRDASTSGQGGMWHPSEVQPDDQVVDLKRSRRSDGRSP